MFILKQGLYLTDFKSLLVYKTGSIIINVHCNFIDLKKKDTAPRFNTPRNAVKDGIKNECSSFGFFCDLLCMSPGSIAFFFFFFLSFLQKVSV